jgi:hypothetical protein
VLLEGVYWYFDLFTLFDLAKLLYEELEVDGFGSIEVKFILEGANRLRWRKRLVERVLL